MNNTNQPTETETSALRASLDTAREDLHNLVFSEAPMPVIVQQQSKIRALKGKITRLENAEAVKRLFPLNK